MKKPGSYAINTSLACGVLYYVLDLSASGRTLIDYAVIGLVVSAILWNVVQLSFRLHRRGCKRGMWGVQSMVFLWIIGLFNTVLLRPEDVGGWRHWVGWIAVGLAVIATIATYRVERQVAAEAAGSQE